jgi:hypothetical protein
MEKIFHYPETSLEATNVASSSVARSQLGIREDKRFLALKMMEDHYILVYLPQLRFLFIYIMEL